MKSGINNIVFFFIAIIYLISRLIFITPDAIEKKANRVVFFQEQYAGLNEENKTKLVFRLNAKKKLLIEPFSVPVFIVAPSPLSINKSVFHFCYGGDKVNANQGEPDVYRLS